MRVKDLLDMIDEWNINPRSIWFLDEDKEVKGNIVSWSYIDKELIGHAHPAVWSDSNDVGCIEECLNTIKIYDVPEETELVVDIPDYGQLQAITNWSYTPQGRFSSEVYWRPRL